MNLWKQKKYADLSVTDYPHYEEYEDFYNAIIDKHFPRRLSFSFLSTGMYRDFRHQSYTRYNIRSIVEIETFGRPRNKKVKMQFKYNFKTGRGQWKRFSNGF